MSNITNYLNKVKTAIYGKEVRGAIHDAIKQVYDDASVEHDNANMEVKLARGTHNTLNDRLDNVDEIQAQTNAQLSHIYNVKANTSYVDKKVADIVSGSPKGVYYNLNDLREAFPNGANGVYITSYNGYWNYWDGSDWVLGGIYQSDGLQDGSLSISKMDYGLDTSISQRSSWVIGGLNNTTGDETTSTTRIRTPFIPTNEFSFLTVGTDKQVQFFINCYDEKGMLIGDPTSFNITHRIGEGVAFIRVCAKYHDDSTLDESKITHILKVLKFYNTGKIINTTVVTPQNITDKISWEIGAFSGIDGTDTQSSSRVRSKIIKSSNMTIISTSNTSLYQMFIATYNENKEIVGFSSGWGSISTFTVTEPYYRVMLKFADSRDITDENLYELLNEISITSTYIQGDELEDGSITGDHLKDGIINPSHLSKETLALIGNGNGGTSSNLIGKNLLNLGDSIAAASDNPNLIGYHTRLGEKYRMNVKSYAKGGATITQGLQGQGTNDIPTQVDNAIADSSFTPDYILFDGYTNDLNFTSSMNVGTISRVYNDVLDKSTFCGAFEYIIRTLRNTYPSAKIVWVRPHNMASRPYLQQKEWGDLATEICEKYGVPIADIYKRGNMVIQVGCNSQQGIHTESETDRTHPGNSGYELFYLPLIESVLNSI